MRVGFVGLGAMGLPMSRNLAGADGIEVVFHDVRPDVLEQVAPLGETAGSVAELTAAVDVVFSVLPADRHVRAVAAEVRAAGRAGQAFVDFSTIHPTTIAEVAGELAEVGVETVGVALTRSTAAAQAGELALYMGGPASWVQRLAPAWDAMATETLVFADAGAAKAMKVINNMVVSTIDQLVCEAIVLGARLDVDAASLCRALAEGGADSWALHHHIERYVLPEDLGPGRFSTRYMAKDVALCADLARSVGLPAFFAGLSRAYYRGSVAHGRGDDYHMVAIRVMEALANLGRRATSPPPGTPEPHTAATIARGAAAVQTLISLEALAIAARSSLSAEDAARGMETGSGGNESLRRLVGAAPEAQGPWTYGSLLEDLEATMALAEDLDAPAVIFELGRQVALSLIDRHGAATEIAARP
ncbi:MAG TPA: NAD(P)-dependent oxidoreductase [Baekduia sp.]|nr:NAD(P)-dependent oxidoreductase [Baekduia sp.]